MSFAALVHGAKGITWYTYGGFVEPEKKAFNYGVASSAEAWNATTNLTRRIAGLVPVLLAPDVPQPPVPVVTKGAATDPLGRPSVTMLLKRCGVSAWVLAVNASKEAVSVRIDTRLGAATADVLWEDRRLAVRGGCFEDDFEPFGVHVYRLDVTK